jgi:hypothetical protein
MKREDFRAIPNYYATNALTYIIYNGVVVAFIETYKNFGYTEGKDGKVGKSTKIKRTANEISIEIESRIKKIMDKNK